MAMTGHLFFSSGLWQSLLALVLKSVALMGSPGPTNMAVTATTAAFGIRASLGFVSGAIVGTSVVLLAVATGVVALLMSIPGLGSALTLASSVYILYLAWKIAAAPPPAKRAADGLAPSFVAGFLLAIANPKAWFAIAAVFTGSTLVETSREFDALLKAAVLTVMIVIIHLFWMLGGVSLTSFLGDPLRSRIANILFGLILVGTTVLALVR
jgi:threonine/homoserine/homoserine lactone efflux protein